MFQIDDDMTIYVTRGDVGYFSVSAEDHDGPYIFRKGDAVQIKVTRKKDCSSVVMQKDFAVMEETERVNIFLTEEDTRIGDVISKPVDYWYEITLNPYTNPQTIVGYDDDGAKIFKLFPEGKDLSVNGDLSKDEITEVDAELSLISQKPVENRVVTQAVLKLNERIEQTNGSIGKILEESELTNTRLQNLFSAEEGNTDFEREVADIRVGVNGEVYPSAGDAVREQVRTVIETAKRLTNDVLRIKKSETLYYSNNRMDISAYKVGDAIGREAFQNNGHGTEFGDIRSVKKGNIFTLENNERKFEYEIGVHGVIACDEKFVITEIIHAEELEANDWRYTVKDDGYLYIGYKALEVAYEIIEHENFIDEFERRCSSTETEIAKNSDAIEELKEKTKSIEEHVYVIDSEAYTYGDDALQAILDGKQIFVKVPNKNGGTLYANFMPVIQYQLPNVNNDYLTLFYLKDGIAENIMVAMATGSFGGVFGEITMRLSKTYKECPLKVNPIKQG